MINNVELVCKNVLLKCNIYVVIIIEGNVCNNTFFSVNIVN